MKDMTKITDFIKKNKYPLILAAAVFVLCIYPLSFTQIYTGHDLNFHLSRIDCIAENIRHGKLLSPIYYTHLDGYGYASPLFYGDIFLHIPALLVVMGMQVETSLRVFIMMITTFTAFATYHYSQKMFGNKLGALTASIAYTFSSYFCVDFITRVAIGELQTFAFIPLIAYGFYSIVCEDGKKWYLLSIGLAGCLLSHVMTSAFCVVFLIIFSLIFIRRFIEKPKRLAIIALSAAVFFCLTAFFIFPLLEQMGGHELAITDGSAAVQWGTLSSRTMPADALFSPFVTMRTNDPWIPNGFGLLPFIIFAFLLISEIRKKAVGKCAWPLFLTGIITLLCTTGAFPWESVQSFMGSLQFPWRLFIFVTFFFALSACAFITSTSTKKVALFAALAVMGFSVFLYYTTGVVKFNNMYNKYSKDEKVEFNYKNTISGGEYMPTLEDPKTGNRISASTMKSRILKRGEKVSSNNIPINMISFSRDFNVITVDFCGNESSDAYIDVPLLMYKGYTATIDGKPAEVTYADNTCAVRVLIGSIEKGTVVVEYTGTTLRKICVIISAISLFVFIAYLIFIKTPYYENFKRKMASNKDLKSEHPSQAVKAGRSQRQDGLKSSETQDVVTPRKAPTPSQTYTPAHEAKVLSSEELPESGSGANYNRETE